MFIVIANIAKGISIVPFVVLKKIIRLVLIFGQTCGLRILLE